MFTVHSFTPHLPFGSSSQSPQSLLPSQTAKGSRQRRPSPKQSNSVELHPCEGCDAPSAMLSFLYYPAFPVPGLFETILPPNNCSSCSLKVCVEGLILLPTKRSRCSLTALEFLLGTKHTIVLSAKSGHLRQTKLLVLRICSEYYRTRIAAGAGAISAAAAKTPCVATSCIGLFAILPAVLYCCTVRAYKTPDITIIGRKV